MLEIWSPTQHFVVVSVIAIFSKLNNIIILKQTSTWLWVLNKHDVAVSCGYDTWFAVRLMMDYTTSHFTWSNYTQKSTKSILALKLSVSVIFTPRWTATHDKFWSLYGYYSLVMNCFKLSITDNLISTSHGITIEWISCFQSSVCKLIIIILISNGTCY